MARRKKGYGGYSEMSNLKERIYKFIKEHDRLGTTFCRLAEAFLIPC